MDKETSSQELECWVKLKYFQTLTVVTDPEKYPSDLTTTCHMGFEFCTEVMKGLPDKPVNKS